MTAAKPRHRAGRLLKLAEAARVAAGLPSGPARCAGGRVWSASVSTSPSWRTPARAPPSFGTDTASRSSAVSPPRYAGAGPPPTNSATTCCRTSTTATRVSPRLGDEREQLIDHFAQEFLLPGDDVRSAWVATEAGRVPGRSFSTSRRATACPGRRSSTGCATCNLIDGAEARRFRADIPQRGDFLAAHGSQPVPDLEVGTTGAHWRKATLAAWSAGARHRATGGRTALRRHPPGRAAQP